MSCLVCITPNFKKGKKGSLMMLREKGNNEKASELSGVRLSALREC